MPYKNDSDRRDYERQSGRMAYKKAWERRNIAARNAQKRAWRQANQARQREYERQWRHSKRGLPTL